MRIAVTGGIAEGKSTVIRYLRSAGVPVVSSDEVAAKVFQTPEVQSWVSRELGLPMPVSAVPVRAAMSSNAGFRRRLNAITHPAILRELEESGAAVAEVPLLFEACLQGRFERIWVVTCGAEEQLRRLVARVGDPQAARALLDTQLPTEMKCVFADRIIRTNLDEASVQANVVEAVSRDLT
jgi:dephospho-CoA kinase